MWTISDKLVTLMAADDSLYDVKYYHLLSSLNTTLLIKLFKNFSTTWFKIKLDKVIVVQNLLPKTFRDWSRRNLNRKVDHTRCQI